MTVSRTRAPRWAAAIACLIAAATLTPTAWADPGYHLDRWYRMGDDSEEPAPPGMPAGTDAELGLTFDSAGSFQDLSPVGQPLYVDISSDQPFPDSTLDNRAISFDGASQYLFALGLNNPDDADESSQVTEDYTGISDRGYQLWFKPTVASTGAEQNVLDDADTHRTLIGPDGNIGFETRTDVQISGTPAEAGAWTHVAQVRPDGVFGGSLGWVNGRAVVSQTGGYPSSDLNLAIAADVESDGVGGSQFTASFEGLVSDVEMFVLGGSYGEFNYTTDNGYFTDVFLPTTSGYGYSDANEDGHNDAAWTPGDVNFDGALDAGDITAFIDGWRSNNDATIIGAGPGIGDYVTLGLGDLDLDGDTDADDWVTLRATGISAGVAAFASAPSSLPIPEPASTVLLALAALARLGASRRSFSRFCFIKDGR